MPPSKKPTPKKKLSRKSLVKKLDNIFSLYIRQRDKRCIVCKTKQQLNNGHLFSRAAYSTRWDEENCNAQCWPCNFRHTFDVYPYTQAWKEKYGEGLYHTVYRRYATPRKFSDKELEEMIETYKAKIE